MQARNKQPNEQATSINRMVVAYPVDLPCRIENTTWSSTGTLISINAQYARIACTSDTGIDKIRFDSTLTLKTELKAGSCCLHSVECIVAWKHGQELGLEFKTGAKVGLIELQTEFNGMHRTDGDQQEKKKPKTTTTSGGKRQDAQPLPARPRREEQRTGA